MPASNVPEGMAAGVAVVATAASVFFADSPEARSANLTEPRAATAARATTEVAEDGDEAEELVVDEAAFLQPAGAGVLRVGSFNIQNLGQGTKKDFSRVARIVEQFDLCGIVELEAEQGLRDLVAELGPEWRSLISEREAGTNGRPGTFEFYGFVFRTPKVVPLDEPVGFFPDPGALFSREPFFASFRSGNFDFTMILLHAESPGNSASLTRELEALPAVFAHVQDLDPNENDLLLAGDFNRSPTTDGGNIREAWQPFLALPEMDCAIPDAVLTSLSTKPTGFANHYDEICLQRGATREFTGTQGAFDFVAAMFEGQNKPASSAVSDHLPVWAEFRTDLADDDGTTGTGNTGSGTASGDTTNCCKICRTTKPCGNGCIQRDLNCTQPPGCACAE